jgi:hypothetical protein
MQALAYQLTGQFLGELLDDFSNDLVEKLRIRILENSSEREHDMAIASLCLICLQVMTNFEPFAVVCINDLLPLLPNLVPECSRRFSFLAFIVAFGVDSQEKYINVLTTFLQILARKKSRSTEFTPSMMAEGIKAINVLLARCSPDYLDSSGLFSEVCDFVDRSLTRPKAKIILAALETVSVLYDILLQVADLEDLRIKNFTGRYLGKFVQLPSQVSKKTATKEVRNKCRDLSRYFDGDPVFTTDLTLNNQEVHANGAREVVLVDAIRSVTQSYFEQTMSTNTLIHALFGWDLLSRTHALRLKKKMKDDIKRDRVSNRKDNDMSIAKKRKQKEDRQDQEDF